MTEDELRDECTEFIKTGEHVTNDIGHLMDFAYRMQAEWFREVVSGILNFPTSKSPLENLILTQIAEWCESQARERERWREKP